MISPFQALAAMLAGGAVVAIIAVAYYFYWRPWKWMKDVPGPPLPWSPFSRVFAHAKIILEEPPGVPHLKWSLQYGGIVRYFFMMCWPRLLVTDPVAVRQILADSQTFQKPPRLAKQLKRIVGNGLLVSEGKDHTRQRKILRNHFAWENLSGLVPLFARHSYVLADKWESLLDQASAGQPVEAELYKEFSQLTLDIIGVTGFGYDFGAVTSGSDPLLKAYSHILRPSGPWRFITFVLPFLRLLPLPVQRKENSSIKYVRERVYKIVEQHKEDLKNGAIPEDAKKTLLDLMLEPSDVSEDHLTSEEVTDQVLTFLAAGHETTSNALAWTWYLLCQHPEVEARARAEVISVLGTDKHPKITWDTLSSMPYLQAVCKESLRLYPPAPIIIRNSPMDRPVSLTLSSGKSYTVPPNSVLGICPYAMHRLPSIWPDSPNEFKPERFMEHREGQPSRKAATFLPFISGPRSCIGQRFALAEMQTAMAVLLQRFTMKQKPNTKVVPKLTITMRPYPGFFVHLERVKPVA